MSVSQHIAHAASLPPYCKNWDPNPVPHLTPAQVATCLKAGWDEPTTHAAHLASSAPSPLITFLIAAVVTFLVLKALGGSRREGRAAAGAGR